MKAALTFDGSLALMGARRATSTSHAFIAAWHDISLPKLPPVKMNPGDWMVVVGTTLMREMSMPSLYATHCATLV